MYRTKPANGVLFKEAPKLRKRPKPRPLPANTTAQYQRKPHSHDKPHNKRGFLRNIFNMAAYLQVEYNEGGVKQILSDFQRGIQRTAQNLNSRTKSRFKNTKGGLGESKETVQHNLEQSGLPYYLGLQCVINRIIQPAKDLEARFTAIGIEVNGPPAGEVNTYKTYSTCENSTFTEEVWSYNYITSAQWIGCGHG